MIWTILHIADILLWLFLAASGVYVAFFAIVSLFGEWKRSDKDEAVSATAHQSRFRFLVVFPAYREDAVICNSVETFLHQTYPSELFQLVVVSDHMQADTNTWLADQRLTLLQPDLEKSSKAKALQMAMSSVSGDFTQVVILDADNLVSPDFLSLLCSSCAKGYKAIQCHRTAKNSDNDIAALDGLSEEINNTIFRKAHNIIGLSSALIGSGMCFDYAWFKENVALLDSAVEDRELEALLLRQRIFIKYEENIHVKDEKVSSQDNFQRQRLRWMTGQVQSLIQMLPHLPEAFLSGNINYIDKTIQQMLIPRSLLLTGTVFFAITVTLIHPAWSIKWWFLLASIILAILIAIPSQLRTFALLQRVTSLPHLAWHMLRNIFHIDKNNKDFLHTTHDK